ncbi:MAG: hypothetical protein LBT03_00085 [Holosporales bacterium]|jgi:hypothetical protein|nr:hypothetical protein [Holosporales bacterium]
MGVLFRKISSFLFLCFSFGTVAHCSSVVGVWKSYWEQDEAVRVDLVSNYRAIQHAKSWVGKYSSSRNAMAVPIVGGRTMILLSGLLPLADYTQEKADQGNDYYDFSDIFLGVEKAKVLKDVVRSHTIFIDDPFIDSLAGLILNVKVPEDRELLGVVSGYNFLADRGGLSKSLMSQGI